MCDLAGQIGPGTVCSSVGSIAHPTSGAGSRGDYKLYPDGRQYNRGWVSRPTAPRHPTQWRIEYEHPDSPPIMSKTQCDFDGLIDPHFKARRCLWKSEPGVQCPGSILTYPDNRCPSAYSTEFISRTGERFCGVGPTTHMEDSSAGYGSHLADQLWYERPHLSTCPVDPEKKARFRNRIILKHEADMGISTREMTWAQTRRVASSDLDANPSPWRGADRQVIQRERKRSVQERRWNDSSGKTMQEQLSTLPDFLFLNKPSAERSDRANEAAMREHPQTPAPHPPLVPSEDPPLLSPALPTCIPTSFINPLADSPSGPPPVVHPPSRRTLFVDPGAHGDDPEDEHRVSLEEETASSVRFAACLVNRALEPEIRAGKFKFMAVDGSFCCNNKYQLVTLWGKRAASDTVQVPLFTILMEGKRREDYDRVFQRVASMFPEVRPAAFSADFERPLWESFSQHFGSRFAGCLYHFLNNMDKQMALKSVPAGWRAYIRASIAEVAMSATIAMRDDGLAKLLSDLGAGPSLPGYSEIKGTKAFGRYFLRHYVGLSGRDAVVAGPSCWCVAGRSAEETEMIQVTNNMAEHANKKTKAYMASKGTKLCSTPKYMHYLADAFLELFTIPALYRDAVDSRGRKRIPTRKSRKSDDTLGSAAVCSARALEQAELTPPPAPLRSRSSSVVPTMGGVDFTMSVPTSRTRRPPGKLLMPPPPPPSLPNFPLPSRRSIQATPAPPSLRNLTPPTHQTHTTTTTTTTTTAAAAATQSVSLPAASPLSPPSPHRTSPNTFPSPLLHFPLIYLPTVPFPSLTYLQAS